MEAVNPNVGLDVVVQWGRKAFKWSLHQKKQAATHFYHYRKSNANVKFWSLTTKHESPFFIYLSFHYTIRSLAFIKDIPSAFGSLDYNCLL